MGVVYHSNYLVWFEAGRTEMFREIGYPYSRIEEAGLMLPVVHAEIDYKRPARYDDAIVVYTRVQDYSNVRLDMAYEVRRHTVERMSDIVPFAGEAGLEPAGELLVTGMTRHVWINREFRTARIDQVMPDLYALIDTISES